MLGIVNTTIVDIKINALRDHELDISGYEIDIIIYRE